jgi:hypothetical protein
VLDEGYQDRVQEIADAVIQRSQTVPMKKEDVLQAIETESGYNRVPEYGLKDRKGSKAWPDFVKDVMAALKGKVKMDRKTGPNAAAAEKRVAKERMLAKISMDIDDAVGQAFPDGDPIDILAPKLRRMGIDEYDIQKWLDAAVKAHSGAKSFDEYMGNMYDDYAGDNPSMMLDSGITRNPYTNRPFNFINLIGDMLKHGQDGEALNIIANTPASSPDAVKIVSDNKATIMRALLGIVKRGGTPTVVRHVMDSISRMKLYWPELAIIRRSIEADKLRESMQPGDVLMIEDLKEAVVGTVLSIDGDMIILEGGVYPLDEEDLQNNTLAEFARDPEPERDDDGKPQFMEWQDFIAAVANLTKSSFDVKPGFKNKKLEKTQAVAKFIPHDPYEHGPVMLYAFKDRRPPFRIGIRAHMQVGTYTKHKDQILTQYQIPKNNLREVDMTPANATMVAHAIMKNTGGALKTDMDEAADAAQQAAIAIAKKKAHKVREGFNKDEFNQIIVQLRDQGVSEAIWPFSKEEKPEEQEPEETPEQTKKRKRDVAIDVIKHFFHEADGTDQDDSLDEAEYHGREVKLGKPMPGDVKKFRVYVKDPKTGNIKKVNFGDPNMEIKRDDPERRKNFRARHGCGTPRASDRTKAAYWSCRLWSTKKVSDILKGK